MAAGPLVVALSEPPPRTGRVLQIEGMFDVPPDVEHSLEINVAAEMVDIAEGRPDRRGTWG